MDPNPPSRGVKRRHVNIHISREPGPDMIDLLFADDGRRPNRPSASLFHPGMRHFCSNFTDLNSPHHRQQAAQPPSTDEMTNEIIDLTGEESPRGSNGDTPVRLGDAARGPRFANSIIDLSADSPAHSPQPQPPVPDIEFLHSRTLPPPTPSRVRHSHPSAANPMEPPVAVPAVLPFLEGNGDPFGMDNIRRNFQFAMGSMEHLLRRSTQLSDHLNLRRTTRATDDARRSTIMVVNGMNRASHFNSEADSSASSSFGSEMLDVEMSGPEEGSATDASYQAPPTPPLGFTRTPTVNDVLVCPNCDEELCVGDDDVAKQVWAIKACGHVYCGECAVNRFKSKRRNSRKVPRGKTFTSCVVDGCTAKTTPRAMIQLYI